MAETPYSIFNSRDLDDIHREIQEVYLENARPWVIGYSGGKDSTTALQLIWYALAELPPEQRKYPVYVISSDTLVETPVIVSYITGTLDRIETTAREQEMPFQTALVRPRIDDTFWVNLIGRGYPAPYTRFRWCTDRMKIRPANQFILDRVAEHGEVIMVLGVRKGESATRDQVLSLHRIKESLLSLHTTLPNAFVYTPVVDFTTDDVWMYLLSASSPWGGDNKQLLTLYRNTNAQGECPLVVDETTPSCGNSRFGCWTCTVVTKDKAMEGLIDNGEDWMLPLLEFRDFLASTQDPEKKPEIRERRRRNGQITILNNKLVHGPYTLEFCKKLLKELLNVQKLVRKKGPDPNIELITDVELEEIRKIWRTERQDWEDAVPQIYAEIVGERDWILDDTFSFRKKDKEILEAICEEKEVPVILVSKLLDTEQQMDGMSRRAKIQDRIDEIFHEDWRSAEEVYSNIDNSGSSNDSPQTHS
ncbi:MAG: DNA phosphorothioation system sulfurtransferase DndC [Candidatus Poribacteria bacterium]|nr:DNA phosphorothioation system sulfurtransferase DndC [Candidatus Poribacteria bacterium]